MSAPCRCDELTRFTPGHDYRRMIYIFGHRRGCPQYVPLRVKNAARSKPLLKPLRRHVGKRRERRGQTKPRR